MEWHYSENGGEAGPVPQAEFDRLVHAGRITSDTLVWRDGMPEWSPYGSLHPTAATAGAAAGAHPCAECGRTFPEEDMIAFGSAWVCAECKPRFVQKLKEGIAPAGLLNYAGFWIRVGAKIIDGIILQAISFCIGLVIGVSLRGGPAATHAGAIGAGVGLLIGLTYSVWFNGRFGATPGKMALKLKIVRPDGEPITYARAFGRYFAEMLSGMILFIGYLMVAWDEQKRALHDRICDTRVIRR
jgi:uncharacterized RDD family membrane protein YckC